ncbi:MAG: DUF7507 domain-containing protein [Coriobacteriia bacterium]
MTRAIHRRSLLVRIFSTYVVVVVLISFAGLGYALPGDEPVAAPASVDSTETPKAAPDPVTETGDEPKPAPDPLVVDADEATTPVEESGDDTAAPVDKQQPVGALTTPLAPVIETVTTTTAGAKLTLEGYNMEQATWTTGNLKTYQEGDWVAHRLIIDNTGNDTAAYSMPMTAIQYDHYWDNSDAIFYDKTRNWGFSSSTSVPTNTNSGIPAGNSGFPCSIDVPVSGTWGVDAPQLQTSWAADVIVVPPGEYGVVYWQAHLALSAYWKQMTDNWGAGPWSSGSPSHTWLYATGEGAKKVPIPSVDLPAGSIAGLKFNDLANRGSFDAGEPGLGDWTFHLTGGPAGFEPLDLHAISSTQTATLGEFTFPYLPSGTYYLTESAKTGWSTAYSLPLQVVITNGETASVKVGNYHADVHKSFSLTIGTTPMGTTYFVRYWINGNTAPQPDLTVPGTGVMLPYETVIDKVEWYASLGGQDYLLGTQLPAETLTDAENVNTFTYNNTVSGRKWYDSNEDGDKDTNESWLSGWFIELRRESDDSLYAVDETDADGRYSFADVLPGDYYVVEVLKSGWFQTHAPGAALSVADDYSRTDLDFGNAEVLSAIDVAKTGDSVARVGDTVEYEITVTNAGMTTLTGVTVTDPMFGTLGTIPIFLPGASQTYYPTRVVLIGDPDPLINTVTAMGTDLLGAIKSDVDSWTVDIVHPDYTLTKSVDPDLLAFEGDVTYTYTLVNTGDVPLYGLSLEDDQLGTIAVADTTLTVGETYSVDVSAHLTQDTTNVATSTAYDVWESPYERTDTAEVDVREPAISIAKSATPPAVHEGDMVTYTYLITNTGDTLLTDIVLWDDVLFDLTYTLPFTSLAPGASMTAQITVPIDDDVVNIGYVQGTYGTPDTAFFGTVSDASAAGVDVLFPALLVRKVADPTTVLAGETVTYSYEVENSGDTTLTAASLYDDHLGWLTLSDTTLSPGEIVSASASAEISVDTVNIAEASAFDAIGGEVTATAQAAVNVVAPQVEIDKSVDSAIVAFEGTVYYDFAVTNTGDVTLYDVAVTDDVIGYIGTIAELAPDETYVFENVAWLVDADVTNIGEATGEDGFGHSVIATDTAEVDVINPAIDVRKSVEPTTVLSGETVTYTYDVENVGDVTLYDVTLDDVPLGPITLPDTELVPGEIVTVMVDAAITQDTMNVATGEGWYGPELGPQGAYMGSVVDVAEAFVEVATPAITLEKSVDPAVIAFTDTVVYTYIITNTGDVELLNVNLVDDQIGLLMSGVTLGVGESLITTVSAEISEDTTNIAEVSGEDAGAHPVSDVATAFVDVVHPDIDVEKSADKEFVIEPGEDVVYTYTVTNTGDVPLIDVLLTDDVLGVVGTLVSLAVGESINFEVTAFIDEDTTNTVVATATDGRGYEVSDSAVENVVFEPLLPFPPDLSIEKTPDKETARPGETVTYTLVYRNLDLAPNSIATNFIITDDFDGRYLTVVDAAGGTVSGSTITWFVPGPLGPGESGTITYRLKVDSDMPIGTTNVDNVVVLDYPDDPDTSNNRDEARVRVSVTEPEEPFLPFTGGDATVLLGMIALTSALGAALRRRSRLNW